jgi:hypothetical protein
VVKGLAIDRFSIAGIYLSGGTGHRVEGNFLGTGPSGTSPTEGNGYGVNVFNTDDSTIGGTSPKTRNLISGNAHFGTSSYGVWLQVASGNTIEGKLIGTDTNGLGNLGNGNHGIRIDNFSDDTIVGGKDEARNVIASNGGDGVSVESDASIRNSLLQNSTVNYGGLGIDLGADGVTANDPKDSDTGPNRLQNYLLLTSAITFGPNTIIKGTLNSTPSTRLKKRIFIIQFFISPSEDPSHSGEGKINLGQTQVSADRQGNASFSFAPFQRVFEGQFVTATTTNQATGDTSEFSRARVVEPPVIEGSRGKSESE